jgi:hypothetical protein
MRSSFIKQGKLFIPFAIQTNGKSLLYSIITNLNFGNRTGMNQDIQDFCDALQPGDFEAAEATADLLGAGFVSSIGKAACRFIE